MLVKGKGVKVPMRHRYQKNILKGWNVVMLKIKEEKDFNTYDEYVDYIQELVRQGILCEGCTYCMTNGGCSCSLEDAVNYSKGDRICCTPISYILKEMLYPVSCIKDWFGKDSLHCTNCYEIIPYEKWDYDEDNNKVCPYCENELEEF